MSSLLVLVRKKKSLSTEDFRRVWSEEYGALCRNIPQIIGYRQFHLSPRRNKTQPIDGAAFMDFDSNAGMLEAWKDRKSATLRESLMQEGALGLHRTLVHRKLTIVEGPNESQMLTLLVVVRKKEGISTEDFRHRWNREYGPLYRKMPQVKFYQQYHLDDQEKDRTSEHVDGVALLTFLSKEDMDAAWKSDVEKEASLLRGRLMDVVHVSSVDRVVKIV